MWNLNEKHRNAKTQAERKLYVALMHDEITFANTVSRAGSRNSDCGAPHKKLGRKVSDRSLYRYFHLVMWMYSSVCYVYLTQCLYAMNVIFV